MNEWQFFVTMYSFMNLRYLIIAGLAFWIFYVIRRRRIMYKKIQQSLPSNKDYRREILNSLLTLLIFTVVAGIIFNPRIIPHTMIYRDIGEWGWPYLFLSFILSLVIHDTYFYWAHRLMHHPRLFKYFHLTHHKSTNPSPWAAFSFQPLEAIVEAGIVILLVFIIPIHPLALLFFMLFMTTYNVYGHLGWELFPEWLVKSPLGKWLNTSVNHNMHHKYFHGNYGLYFRFWDEWMGTTHKRYDEVMDAVQKQRALVQ